MPQTGTPATLTYRHSKPEHTGSGAVFRCNGWCSAASVCLDSCKDGANKREGGREADGAEAEVGRKDDNEHVAHVQQNAEAVHGGEVIVQEDEGVDEEVHGGCTTTVEGAPPPVVVLGTKLHVPAATDSSVRDWRARRLCY